MSPDANPGRIRKAHVLQIRRIDADHPEVSVGIGADEFRAINARVMQRHLRDRPASSSLGKSDGNILRNRPRQAGSGNLGFSGNHDEIIADSLLADSPLTCLAEEEGARPTEREAILLPLPARWFLPHKTARPVMDLARNLKIESVSRLGMARLRP